MPIPAGPATSPVVTVGDLKQHLNLSANSTAADSELQRHLDAAIAAVEKRIGPIITRDFTERLEARGGKIVVSKTPLVSVTALTEVVSGVAWSDVAWDAAPSGVITGRNGWRLVRGRYDVTYLAGRGATASADHQLAVLYVAEHFYEMQRKGAPGRPGLMGEAGETSAGAGETAAGFVYRGFALPRRALELLSGDEEIGFA